jgi:hypothetical protein
MKRSAFLGGTLFGCVLGLGMLAHASLGGSTGVVIPYQGHLDRDGNAVTGMVTLGFDIYNGGDAGVATTPCYRFNPGAPTAVSGGQFSVLISGVPENCVSGQEVYVGTRVTVSPDPEVALLGRQRIYAVVGALTSGKGDFAVQGSLSAASANITGAVTAATATVGSVHVGYVNGVQGAHLNWNRSNGGGETNFVNHKGLGSGGFAFEQTSGPGTAVTSLMTVDGNGVIRGPTFGFGGLYSVLTNNGTNVCGQGVGSAFSDVVNPITGGFNCPGGVTAGLVQQFDVCIANVGARRYNTYMCWK